MSNDAQYVMAIDQGTTSSRAIIFDHAGDIVSVGQLEHEQIFPRPGWVEHDAQEIWANVNEAIGQALAKAQVNRHQLAAVGITNQRETTVVWDRHTGEPVHHAIVWQDTRTQEICDRLAADGGIERYRSRTGLPLSSYFAGPKVTWILENVPGARARAEAGDLLMGTMDTWVLWNLTGGVDGGVHLTDVTNASRTLLMDLRTLQWDPQICADLGIPMSMLPQIRSSSEIYGEGRPNGLLIDTPIAGILGDQQAATFGQACFEKGSAKNTYGTGCFLLMNTGTEPVFSDNGLLTTVGYKIGDQPTHYALEGSIAVAGSLVQWLRDNLRMFDSSAEVEKLALEVADNGGAYIVPAFSGLFAPYWRPEARGALVGLTRFVNRGHIARAVLESTAYQTRDVVQAMFADSGVELTSLKVDGGMVANETLMQFQADILGAPVVRPQVAETTALGAAYAAGIAVGYWAGEDDVVANWQQGSCWTPSMDPAERERLYRCWQKAVTRTFDWIDEDTRQ
ncbi:glycerol kinase GlpK [Raineyella sp. LH-20]|uniref:glycerol kinase GlpK n=1 Tax=Raineyella sp. LH-20 TaxID=3081204 RepID=UPI002953CDFF|nr:glycerol kinase GlpK [Raineyella sp. LH-20]WOP18526.1 glycerol kinase GlpK [Raineyella sp. LH-20]